MTPNTPPSCCQPGVFIGMLASRSLRDQLRTPGPYVAALIASLAFTPVVFMECAA